MSSLDPELITRALALAARGRGGTAPNPMVGAVIVRDDVVVGEGWHHRAGKPHAEIEALAAAKAAGADVRGATMYVTLEPCCHQGRTGPCTKAVIAAGIRRVVIAALDPNPIVAGRGVAELRAAGVEVVTGVEAAAAHHLNRVFDKWILSRRPWVTLKLAQSVDGRIARRPGETTAVTGPAVLRRVHELRAAHDAVMVGRVTAAVDAPRLTVRGEVSNPEFLPPWRVLVDSQLVTPIDAPIFSDAAPGAIVATAINSDDPRVQRLVARGVRVHSVPDADGRVDLRTFIERLGTSVPEPVTSILCEGGGVLAASLLAADLVDELVVFVAPKVFGAGGVPAFGALAEATTLTLDAVERLDDDVALTYLRRA